MVEAARWRSRAQQIAQDVWLPHSADYLSALALFMHTSSSFIYKFGSRGNFLQYRGVWTGRCIPSEWCCQSPGSILCDIGGGGLGSRGCSKAREQQLQ